MRNISFYPRPDGHKLSLEKFGEQRPVHPMVQAYGLTPAELIELAKLAQVAAGVDEETAEDWAWMARRKIEDTEPVSPYAGDGIFAASD
jgi:hypothetical protein